jgi:hypothetical protein
MRRALVALLLMIVGCGGGPTALHDLHQTSASDFYDLPFPSDAHLKADGTIDFTLYKRTTNIVDSYIDTISAVEHGFGLSAGMFFRFDAPLDPASLPQAAADSLLASSSVFLVDVTPGSPTYDKRLPVRARFTAGAYEFIGVNWLGVIPIPGLPMREKTHYACVLTDGIHGTGGHAIRRAADFDAVVAKNAPSSGDAKIAAAAKAYAPFVAWLAAHPDVAPHVVNAAVFTTADETPIMKKLRDAVYAQAPAPTLENLQYDGEDKAGVDQLYEGTYAGPNFQTGTPPYSTSGGQIIFGSDGTPKVDHMETALRFAMTIPEGTMPANGWPVVIYQHGTGGNYMDFVGDGSGATAANVTAGDGSLIAQMAMVSTDQVLHGTRSPPGTDYDIAFFNFQNPYAVHDNPHQGALDGFSVVRLLHSIDVAAAPSTGQHIKFDLDRIYFKGHSQGGLTGPLFLAAEPEVKGAILSGAGGDLVYSILYKTQPVNIPNLVQLFFADHVDEFHPFLNLIQDYFDDADPVTYGRLIFQEPIAGNAPKSIFQSLGIVDHYAPYENIEALSLAIGNQPEGPMLQPIDNLALTSLTWGMPPTMNNVAGGKATGVLLEYDATMGEDGHFVVFDEPNAANQANRFLATHAATGTSRLDPP